MTGSAQGGAPTAGDEEALRPHLPGLLDGLSALAPLDEGLVDLLVEAGLPPGARVLDPACGRGGAALVLAARLGCLVDGVDVAEGLIAEAEAEGRRRGLPCRFRVGAPEEALAAAAGNRRDAVIWLGMGRALGGPAETVGALRRALRPGGLLLLEDAFLREGAAPLPDEPYRPRLATLAGLCAHGDLVVGERIAADDEVRAANRRDLGALAARAAALGGRHPALQGTLTAWLEAQAAQVVALERSLQSATWVLMRGDG